MRLAEPHVFHNRAYETPARYVVVLTEAKPA